MGAQEKPSTLLSRNRWRIHVQRVVHVHGRVIRRKVQGGEVVPVGLDLGAHRNSEPDATKDFNDLVHHLGDRMLRAGPATPARHGEIDAGSFGAATIGVEHIPPGRERLFEAGFQPVDGGAIGLALLRADARRPT